MEKFKLTLPAVLSFSGDIIVTDPCYFIPKDIWSELIDAWFDNNEETEYAEQGVIEFENGVKVLYTGTAYGDGEYPVYVNRRNGESVHSNSTGVDAGMVAVISVDDLRKLNPRFNVDDERYPRINDFDGTIKANGEGDFVGDLEVNTHDEPEIDTYEEESDRFADYEDDDM